MNRRSAWPYSILPYSLLLAAVAISSCVIAQKNLTTNLSSQRSVASGAAALGAVEDHRKAMHRKHFPDADIQFMHLLENELIGFLNVTMVTRSEIEAILEEEAVLKKQKLQLSDMTDSIVKISKIKNVDYVIVGKLYDYGWSATAFSVQIVDVSTGEVLFGASYSDNEPLWIPLFLSAYHPNRQMRRALTRMFDALSEKSQRN